MPLFSKPAETADDKHAGLFARLGATRRALGRGLADLLVGARTIDADLLEDMEALLLGADVGVEATQAIIAEITERLARKQLADAPALAAALRETLIAILAPCARPLVVPALGHPFVIMAVGVNGAGKTTTIGKLAHRLKAQGQGTMLAAADTFRAAAIEQLQAWGGRNDVPVIAQASGADAASVAHDAMQAAAARAADVLIVDTAGRLHTQSGLMDELKKIKRVIQRFDPQAPHEVLLVLDGGTGQNALLQAEHFHAAIGVTGLALTKLDGTAKGGVLFAIARKTGLPIRFIGVGEGLDDLREFDPVEFVDAILAAQP